MLLNHGRSGRDRAYRSMDDVVLDLLKGKAPEPQEEGQLLAMLGWRREERLLCMRLESQVQSEAGVVDHALHSDLFQVFPRGYILFSGHQQCVLLNLDREALTLPMLRHRLSPLCRDYCLYAGISSPVRGTGELCIAYQQSRVALEKAFQLGGERWAIPFSDCALEYMLARTREAMPLNHLVAPELYALIAHDREKGTQYYETLRAYLLNERDIPRTAEALIIHRTTLLYRLRKLQSVASIDLDDPARRLHLLISLWILDGEGMGTGASLQYKSE
jgi:sugar diacid utilization regulator